MDERDKITFVLGQAAAHEARNDLPDAAVDPFDELRHSIRAVAARHPAGFEVLRGFEQAAASNRVTQEQTSSFMRMLSVTGADRNAVVIQATDNLMAALRDAGYLAAAAGFDEPPSRKFPFVEPDDEEEDNPGTVAEPATTAETSETSEEDDEEQAASTSAW